MTEEKKPRAGLDELLRKAFADDLPDDVAAGMRELAGRFRGETIRGVGPASPRAWLFRRSVWAVLSVLMLATGILLQGLGSQNRLADRISVIMSEYAGSDPGRRPGVAPETRGAEPDRIPGIRRKKNGQDS